MRLNTVRRSLTQCEQCVLVPDELGYGPLPVLLPATQPDACLCMQIAAEVDVRAVLAEAERRSD